ncbi:MAG: SDR family oxidoreductase [Alphaproteobacteria bacterium]|nr:SDR family oxidoreductase [Alphaproteobacteria bacterium]
MLAGKTIVVTGAASGIGAATAAELKRQGAAVIGVDLTQAEAVDEFFLADLSDPESIDELAAALPTALDGLCNIAGLPPTFPPEQVLRVNVLGLKRLTYGLVEKFADGAAITNLASLAGSGWADSIETIDALEAVDDFDALAAFCATHDVTGARSYFLSKEAIVVWTMRHRWTWRDRGIRMNAISPGPVETPILADFLDSLGDRAARVMALMDRPGRPADIAPIVAFLQSDGAAWLRGANLTADGGMASHILCREHGLE